MPCNLGEEFSAGLCQIQGWIPLEDLRKWMDCDRFKQFFMNIASLNAMKPLVATEQFEQ